MLADAGERDLLKLQLDARGIKATTHYVPLHSSPAGQRFGRGAGELANTDRAAAQILRLPLHHSLTEAEQDRVISAVWDFFLADTAAASR
jgi:dTDP-4-amino-4,6-dideoxygalactose transaminase